MIFNKYYIYVLKLSFRRRLLDSDLKDNQKYFSGNILDIGGGYKRGYFSKYKKYIWTTVDIDKKTHPDVIADAHNLPFKDNTFNTIKATELLEHVANPFKVLQEMTRVLKKGGYIVLSSPFLYPIHNNPSDYQRITEDGFKRLIKECKLKTMVFNIEGYFFTVLSDMLKDWIKNLPSYTRWLLYIFILPILELMFAIDRHISPNSKILSKYPQGYFFILKKQ